MDEKTAAAEIPPPPLARHIHLDELHALPMPALVEYANGVGMRISPDRSRRQLIFDLLRFCGQRGWEIVADGIVEASPDGCGYLRSPHFNFRNGIEDAYLSQAVMKRFGLRNGNRVSGRLRAPRDREKYMALEEVLAIEQIPAASWTEPKHFDQLTAQFPKERIILENPVTGSLSCRAVDLLAPLGRGQRGLIVAPPRVGKTILLQHIARAIRVTSPETHVILLLLDERPEEVTDMRRSVDADIFSSTFDEPSTRHVQVAELVSERAKRLVEIGKHVVILLDSLTRLARGYNAALTGRGRTMSGGVDAKALMKPKKFFGAARCVEEGGSLTILATALTETMSRMDDVIFEEFKGTGNMELHLDRMLAEKRVFPAIHIARSATRRDDLLYHPDEYERVQLFRKQLLQLPIGEAMEVLLSHLSATKTNAELLLGGVRKVS